MRQAAAMKNKVNFPKYHFHTASSVHKAENCANPGIKSHKARVRRKGLQDIINDEAASSKRKMADYKQIEKKIAEIRTIEASREEAN